MSRISRQNLVAWAVILTLTALFVVSARSSGGEDPAEKPRAIAHATPQQRILMKFVNGMKAPTFSQSPMQSQLLGFEAQLAPYGEDTDVGAELGNAALAARLEFYTSKDGDRGALERLARLRSEIDAGKIEADAGFMLVLADVQQAVEATRAPAAESVSPEAAARIEKSLGLVGRTLVAQARNDRAAFQQLEQSGVLTVVIAAIAAVGALIVGLCGLVALTIFGYQALVGQLRGAGPSAQQWSPVYAEIFAVWMGTFLLLNHGPHILAGWFHALGGDPNALPVFGDNGRMALSLGFSLVAALIALWWGTRRGLSWRTIRSGVALTRVRWSDLGWGVVCYSMGLVLLALGVAVALVLTRLIEGGGIKATHPIQRIVDEADGAGLILTFLVASVSAPIFEEIFFRGALYRNLDDLFAKRGRLVSSFMAILVSSVIFAAIHPQGLLFIPVLGALAAAFCLMREWRGSINPGIVAHAINNTLMLSLNILLLR